MSATPGDSRSSSIAAGPRARVALVHDWLCGYRGGEAVLDRIARLVVAEHECAGLWTMVDDGRGLTPAIDVLTKHTSVLQRVPGGARGLRRWLLPLYPRAVESLSRSMAREHARHGGRPIDLVISTSSAAVKGVRAPAGVPHLCYCHSPARYVWSQREEYGGGGGTEGRAGAGTLAGRLRGAGLSLFGGGFRAWDARTAANVSQFLANSTHTRDEIKRCYGRDAAVVHPPARTEFFTPDASVKREDFWLLVGALEPYKRADLAIEAAMRKGQRLVVVGSGSSRAVLEGLASSGHASSDVRFEGRVSDERLRELYRSAKGLLFPQVEDFGIVAVEAQACGLPVIAQARGGALDSVIDGETGVLFKEASVDALLDAMERFEVRRGAVDWGTRCRANAERFSEAAFDDAMRTWIHRSLTSKIR